MHTYTLLLFLGRFIQKGTNYSDLEVFAEAGPNDNKISERMKMGVTNMKFDVYM